MEKKAFHIRESDYIYLDLQPYYARSNLHKSSEWGYKWFKSRYKYLLSPMSLQTLNPNLKPQTLIFNIHLATGLLGAGRDSSRGRYFRHAEFSGPLRGYAAV